MHWDLIGDVSSSEVDLGYWFDPPCEEELCGHHQLRVWLRPTPTERHYDPEQVRCIVTTGWRDMAHLTIRCPWPRADHYRLCLGMIILNDRKHREVQAFSFGGELSITQHDHTTMCVFDSPAPIYALQEGEQLSNLMVAEVEAVLAEEQARIDVDGRGSHFSERLASSSPTQLYQACLVAIALQLRPLRTVDYMPERDLLHYVEKELQAIQERNPGAPPIPTLGELLSDP
ncbi:MAG: hypothetical protein IPK16_31350 [Anaerolineales bacterium]|nr:hypothetical protein [Anaerolineales bacterium]